MRLGSRLLLQDLMHTHLFVCLKRCSAPDLRGRQRAGWCSHLAALVKVTAISSPYSDFYLTFAHARKHLDTVLSCLAYYLHFAGEEVEALERCLCFLKVTWVGPWLLFWCSLCRLKLTNTGVSPCDLSVGHVSHLPFTVNLKFHLTNTELR